MKRSILILAVLMLSHFANAQNVIYLFGMDNQGHPVINTVPVPGVVNTGSWADILSKPNIPTSLTTTGSGAATMISGVLNIPTPATATPYSAGSGISVVSNVVTNTSPDQTVSLTGSNGITISGTYPNFTIALADPVFNTAVSRSLNASYTISNTKKARVYYTIRIAYNITVLLGSTGSVDLQYSTNGGSTWITVATVTNSLNLGLALTGYNDFPISGEIPANALVRLNSTVTNATNTYQKGEEVTY